jgi:hypothetical protein
MQPYIKIQNIWPWGVFNVQISKILNVNVWYYIINCVISSNITVKISILSRILRYCQN